MLSLFNELCDRPHSTEIRSTECGSRILFIRWDSGSDRHEAYLLDDTASPVYLDKGPTNSALVAQLETVYYYTF